MQKATIKQIKSSYKKTPVGIIPDDWEVKKLNQVSDIVGGYAFDSKKFSECGLFQVVKMSNVYQGTLDLERSQSFITNLTDREKDYLLLKGDILISLTGTVGKEDYGYSILINDEENLLLNQRLAKVAANRYTVHDFLFYIIKTPTFLNPFFNFSRGGTGNQANVSIVDVGKIKLPIPPLPEQKAIADCLSTWDRAIEKQTQLIHAKKQFKKGLMQGFFNGHFGFAQCKQLTEAMPALREPQGTNTTNRGLRNSKPDFTIIKAKEGEDFTEDWEDVRLGELLEIGNGKDYKHLEKGKIPVYGSGGLMTFVNEYLYDGESVGIGRKGTIDKPRFLNGKFWTVDTLFYTHSFKKTFPKFIYYLFLTINWKKYNEASGVPSLSQKTIKKIKTRVPSLRLQTAIARVLQSADQEIELLEKKLALLQLQKKGLMQVLLMGEKRLV